MSEKAKVAEKAIVASAWIEHCKSYAKEHNLTFRQALSEGKSSWDKEHPKAPRVIGTKEQVKAVQEKRKKHVALIKDGVAHEYTKEKYEELKDKPDVKESVPVSQEVAVVKKSSVKKAKTISHE
jgi:hypothetical protein